MPRWGVRVLGRDDDADSNRYQVPAGSLNLTYNGGAVVEMVYRGTAASGAQWTESRVPVASADTATGAITMAVRSLRACMHAWVRACLRDNYGPAQNRKA